MAKWDDAFNRSAPGALVALYTDDAVGTDVRVTGKWKCAFHDTDGKDKHIGGHYSWILVREGDGWKIGRDTADEGTGY